MSKVYYSEMKHPKELSVVIPCFKSELFLENTVEDLVDNLDKLQLTSYEIILVIDGSPDRTINKANEILVKYKKKIKILELTKNFGQHPAILAGVVNARYELILTMDDDGQHPAKNIEVMLNSLDPMTDIIYGLSSQEEHSFFRNTSSRLFKKMTYNLLNLKHGEKTSSYRLFRKKIIDGIDIQNLSHGLIDVILFWSSNRIKSVTVEMKKRPIGRSNYRIIDLFKLAFQLIVSYSGRPIRIITFFAIIVFTISLFFSGILIFERINGKIEVAGFTTIAVLISLIGSVNLLAIGIIGEYIAKINEKSMSKPLFSIRSINFKDVD